MKYIVIELQTASDGTVANLVTAHDTRNSAESKYHQVLSAAAVSALPAHAAVIIDSTGGFIGSHCYEHEIPAEPEEPEPEEEPEEEQ